MNHKINIFIEKPCSENFNNFQITNKGGYCSSCHKEVTNFTNMTPQEIQNYFKVNKTNTCGYFLESQLKTNFNKDSKINPFTIPIIGATLLSFFAINSSFAQKNSDSIEINPTIKNDSNTQKKDSIIPKKKYVVSGVVLDKNQIPISGVVISLKGKKDNVATDFNGKFIFPKSLKKDDNLIISYIGYQTQEVKVSNTTLKVILNEYKYIMGEVSTNKTFKSKTMFLNKVKNWFR